MYKIVNVEPHMMVELSTFLKYTIPAGLVLCVILYFVAHYIVKRRHGLIHVLGIVLEILLIFFIAPHIPKVQDGYVYTIEASENIIDLFRHATVIDDNTIQIIIPEIEIGDEEYVDC